MKRVWTILAAAFPVAAALVTIARGWDEVKRFVEWLYPGPLIVVLSLAVVALGAVVAYLLWGRQRVTGRITVSTLTPESEEQSRINRRTINLIKAEVSGNRRVIARALEDVRYRDFALDRNWEAHRVALAEIPGSEGVYDVVAEAYDEFALYNDVVEGRRAGSVPELEDNARAADRAIEALERLHDTLKAH